MAKSTTAGQHSFAQIPKAEIQRSKFNRSCGLKTTFDAGYLVPIFVDEVLPGDTMNLRMSHFGRLATPIVPVMDNLFLDTFFFAVPIRLIWDNWQKFNGEQENPDDSTDFLVPEMTTNSVINSVGSIHDYLGIPTGITGIDHSALWHRAYNKIYADWFRDENLQDSPPLNKGDGPDSLGDYGLLRRGKRHDYFSSALPFPQKGPAVELPLGSTAPVNMLVDSFVIPFGGDDTPTFDFGTTSDVALDAGPGTGDMSIAGVAQNVGDIMKWNTPNLIMPKATFSAEADLSAATAATINSIREAFQVQRLFERDARGGTRYTEIIRAHFGVTSPDARLQRAEYLGGGNSTIYVNPVAQQSQTDTTPQGTLAAFGTVNGSGDGFNKSFTEHCVIIGLACVRADLNYQQGLERMFSRRTRFDFYWPAFAHLGEQTILNKEIYADGTSADDDTFGYQERYAEYRYKPSKITGQFRSSFGQSLDIWHLAQDFAGLPLLNDDFIEENPPVDRIIATQDYPHLLFDAFFQYTCARPMPTYGVPGLIDHF